jgi:uncharacterized 2Fe-2S/4Fe-4S cluster protein (DUF4445 family)
MPTVHFMPQDKKLSVAEGMNLLDAVRAAGVAIEAPCDGTGTCGKCKAKITAGTDEAFREDAHQFVTEAERKAGWVLACQTAIHGNLQVEVPRPISAGLKIVSEGQAIQVDIDPYVGKRFDESALSTAVRFGETTAFVELGDTTQLLYGLAIDIGTTTLVASLVDLRDGRELAVASSLNPQSRYAQDVLSRIKLASKPEGLDTLHGELIQELNRQVADVCTQVNISAQHIYEVVFSGNTTMMHLATGTNPTSLGKYPYTPMLRGGEHFSAKETGLAISPRGMVYLPPIMSAYVGGDITSGMLATVLAEQSGVVLFVDIGTNGEMVLAVDGNLTATSTAAGPAFEGMNIACGMRASLGAVEIVSLCDEGVNVRTIGDADPVGICGSGLLDVVAELAAHGGVDKNGRFQTNGATRAKAWRDRWESIDGKPVFRIGGPVYLSQKDVRQVQLAKAAIRSGIELLLKANQLTTADVDRVLIAGSFGFHLRTESLINLGLLSRDFRDRVEFVGNTSKTGAQAFLLNRGLRARMQQAVERVRVVELANDPAFEKTFMRSISF